MKDQRDLIRTAHGEMIPDHAFKPHPARLRAVEYAGYRQTSNWRNAILIAVAGPQVRLGKRRCQTPPPASEKALHGRRTEPVTDLLRCFRIAGGAKPVVQTAVCRYEVSSTSESIGSTTEPSGCRSCIGGPGTVQRRTNDLPQGNSTSKRAICATASALRLLTPRLPLEPRFACTGFTR